MTLAEFVARVARLLPSSDEDERVVDGLVSGVAASRGTRKLTRREAAAPTAEGEQHEVG